VQEQPFQCENRIGQFESVGIAFNNSIPQIDHPECIFKGGECCRYIIEWRSNFSYQLRRTSRIIYLILLIVSIVLTVIYPVNEFMFFVPIIISTILAIGLLNDKYTKKELRNGIMNLEHSRDDLIMQMEINYNNSQMVHEIGQTINKYVDLEEIVGNVIQVLEKRLGYDRCLIMFANKEMTRLIFKAGFGYNDNQLEIIKATEFDLTKPESKGVFVVSSESRSLI